MYPDRKRSLEIVLLGLATTFLGADFAKPPRATTRMPLGLPQWPRPEAFSSQLAVAGESLFFSSLLSKDFSLSCASCHKPSGAMADNVSVSKGYRGRTGSRNSPAIANGVFGTLAMWDGRSSSLFDQAALPISSPCEMALSLGEVVSRAKGDKSLSLFLNNDVTERRILDALGSYVSSLVAASSRFDRYYYAGDSAAMSREERLGWELFRGKAKCTSCHQASADFALFTDHAFHVTGIGWTGAGFKDNGRYEATLKDADRGAFKTPTLRNISKTAPYMHDGSLATLDDVIAYYDKGGERSAPGLDVKVEPLNLSEDERKFLLTFLRTLDSEVQSYRPGLDAESRPRSTFP